MISSLLSSNTERIDLEDLLETKASSASIGTDEGISKKIGTASHTIATRSTVTSFDDNSGGIAIQSSNKNNESISTTSKKNNYKTTNAGALAEICDHKKRVDFTITVLTMNRVDSFKRLLASLQATNYDGDLINLVIKIDASADNDEVKDIAESFQFMHGCKKVIVAEKNQGLAMSWFNAWMPKHDFDHGIILEDDIEMAPRVWYIWLKKAWRTYDDATSPADDLAGISLCQQRGVVQLPRRKPKEITNDYRPYLYPLMGSHGFSPHPKQWKKFILWIQTIDVKSFDISTPGLSTSGFWKSQNKKQRRQMWTQYFIYFTVRNNLFLLYQTLPRGETLAAHWREKGEHFNGKTVGKEFELAVEVDAQFPPYASLQRYGWDAEPIATRSTVTSFEVTKTKKLGDKALLLAHAISKPKWQKTISVGNHTNIPKPDSRIGPNGTTGYIHDPTFLLKENSQHSLSVNEQVCKPPGEGFEGIEGNKVLQNIRNHIKASSSKSSAAKDVKLFCAVYTYNGGVPFTDAIRETYGKRCDGLLLAGSESNYTSRHTHLPSNSTHGFGYKGMNQRTRTILAYLYDNFLDDFDYFHLNGDDTYLIVENLKEFLAANQEWEDQSEDHYIFGGFIFSWSKMASLQHYMGGGSGYTLSAKALKRYVEGPLQFCNTDSEVENEDVYLSNCFHEHVSSDWLDSRDASGAHRYHQMAVDQHATSSFENKNNFLQKVLKISMDKYSERFPGTPKMLVGSPSIRVSNSSVAFHKHTNPDYLRRYERILYGETSELNEQCKKFV